MPVPQNPANALLRDPHVVDVEDVCNYFEVDPEHGLSTAAVEVYRARFGSNELEQEEGKSLWTLLFEQFQDLLARILLMAALVSFLLALVSGDEEGLTAFVEPIVILLILVANAAVSVWQESNAEKSLEALKKLQPELARVLRNSQWVTIAAQELVPGDIVEIRVGDKVPADLRVLKLMTVSLRAEQSQLTGETQTVPKESDALDVSYSDCEIQSKINMLFASTTIANGCARTIVVATGMQTEIGHVQSAVQAAGAEEEQTPLQQKLDEFGEMLSKVIGIICILVWVINFGNFNEPSHGGFVRGCIYYFKTAVALAVAAIPEGLTAVITTCLALGTRKMAQKNAIVRRLPSVETLGCTTVICSDKTGTLTTNEMSCVRFCIPRSMDDLDIYNVEGHTYAPVGRITRQLPGGKMEAFTSIGAADRALQYFAKCAAICNESKLDLNPNHPEKFLRHGEPTEAALKVLVEKMGCPDPSVNRANLQTARRRVAEAFGHYWTTGSSRLAVLEFSRDRKSMSVLCKEAGGNHNIQFVKGAPESILERCTTIMLPDGSIKPINSVIHHRIIEQVEHMAGDALRTLALAVRLDTGSLSDYNGIHHSQHKQLMNPENFASFEQNLTFCGLVGLVDPPRPEVAGAISICRTAGIKVIMITGDNKKTAEAIAVKVGIVSGADLSRVSFTGKEFEALPESEKIRVLGSPRGAVFSRTEPKHKQLVIKILKELGEIAAMTGDGVNDAPALKQADIGIAMGITGTEVAKEASDMILADDNFSTIVLAVEEGRSIYNNMKAFIRYLISSNIGEVASIFLTAALGIPEGLAPVQLLWVNLVTDGFPATALGFNPPDVDVMKKTPRRRDDPLISGWVFFRYMVIGLYVGIATVGIFIWWFVYGVDPSDGHSLITFSQLSHWSQCHSWLDFNATPVYGMDPSDPCTYFNQGKVKASTLSLTVLVIIEMFNALNALSEDGSLFHMPPWANPWLVLAIGGSVAVHCAILYIAPLASIFGVVPLSLHDWIWVVVWSFPVLIIDECLKAYARMKDSKARNNVLEAGRPKKTQ